MAEPPRPSNRQRLAGSRLGRALYGFDQDRFGPGGWIILDGPEVHLGTAVVEPALAGWRRERMLVLPETWDHGIAPGWICEVMDPHDRAATRTWRRDLCAEHGVGFLWHVDVEARVLEAFRRDGLGWALVGALHDDEEVRLPPFEAQGWPLAALWST